MAVPIGLAVGASIGAWGVAAATVWLAVLVLLIAFFIAVSR